jgi:hypothetical protein
VSTSPRPVASKPTLAFNHCLPLIWIAAQAQVFGEARLRALQLVGGPVEYLRNEYTHAHVNK